MFGIFNVQNDAFPHILIFAIQELLGDFSIKGELKTYFGADTHTSQDSTNFRLK